MNKTTTILTQDAPNTRAIKQAEKKAKQEFIRNFQRYAYRKKHKELSV